MSDLCRFDRPKKLANYLREQGLFYRGLPYSDQTKVELHEGIDVLGKPMLIRSTIPQGKRTYRPCVHFPNGKVQELTDFLKHWKIQNENSN